MFNVHLEKIKCAFSCHRMDSAAHVGSGWLVGGVAPDCVLADLLSACSTAEEEVLKKL